MMSLDTTPRLFDIGNIDEMILVLEEADEDGWTYVADFDPKGTSPYARIKVLDENGEFVAFFS